MSEENQEELIQIIMRQTDYDYEKSKLKLIEFKLEVSLYSDLYIPLFLKLNKLNSIELIEISYTYPSTSSIFIFVPRLIVV